MVDTIDLGRALVAIREGLGLSQAEAARIARQTIKMPASDLSAIENGKTSPAFVRVAAYLEAIGSSLDTLIGHLAQPKSDPLSEAAIDLRKDIFRSASSARALEELRRAVDRHGEIIDELTKRSGAR